MKITKIEIENFRSIKKATITLDYNGIILIGKNEVGKTNILKAIAALFEKYKISAKDKRKKINNENINRYGVRAIISLEKNEIDQIANEVKEKLCIENKIFKNRKTIDGFINNFFGEIAYSIDLEYEQKCGLCYNKNRNSIEAFELIENSSRTIEDIKQNVWETIKKYYDKNPFRGIFWEYKESYLLPNVIDIKHFTANPDVCEPLKNIFELCNRGNIAQEFKNELEQNGDYINLLSQVSEEVTNRFREIWGDFKSTSIVLSGNGSSILIKVKDNVYYNFEDRSDGFKKLISILLMLSTKNRINKITDRDIILIDEPDQSLYPTSAKYLKEELLRISEKSIVVYSTHSPYMIDNTNIDRHFIVDKKEDITSIKKQEKKSLYHEDELLRNVIGTSIFECIKEKNIIFEGWLDKELFKKHTAGDNFWKNIGSVYLPGIHGVYPLAQLLMLANKSFLVVSDSDEASIGVKEKFIEIYPEYKNNWIDYRSVCNNIHTMEDFYNIDYIIKYLKEKDSKYSYDNKKTILKNISLLVKEDKSKVQNIKKDLVKKIPLDKINGSYNKYIDGLKKILNK